MRGAGFSRAKIAALKDLAAKALDGTLPTTRMIRTLDDEAIIQRLIAVRGIGGNAPDLSPLPSGCPSGR
jgi:DNA-3-methyladenine glycosylase II